ncbi:fibrobacter succinogenes major paralogous domain-containing protein [Alteromonas sp. C1M14]|nr:fibrobacter succinogenes major paralogous domain-containing protein [Alteromonas sp. C1M14]
MVVAATTLAQNMDQELNIRQETVQDVEGNVYRTVTIGDQIWLAENLRSTRFQDGSAVRSGAIPKDDDTNLLKYGRLYNWYDAADERNLCPVGWRVASDDDWKSLERAIGMPEYEVNNSGWRGGALNLGVQLKEAQSDGLFAHFTPSQINRYGFSARPAGVKWHGWYITQGDYSEFWTTSSASDKKAIIRTLAYSWWNKHKGEIRRATSTKDYLFSVRCVKNTT